MGSAIKYFDQHNIKYLWHNADLIRNQFNDWDFSLEGRLRQSERIGYLSTIDTTVVNLCDFVCPTSATRDRFNRHGKADLIIWMDTIDSGRFDDTNSMFEPPTEYDLRIRTYNDAWGEIVAKHIINETRPTLWNNRAPTVQMLGRWQPWHEGHQALFERLLIRTGQVCIQIRDCQGWNDSNPFDVIEVEKNIHRALELQFYGMYNVMVVPNIIHVGYGRNVGYTIEQETFTDEVHSISATDIRKKLGLK